MLQLTKQYRCNGCGYVGKGEVKRAGNSCLEVFLWLCFLVPGMFYSVYRLVKTKRVCPVCGNEYLADLSKLKKNKYGENKGVTQ